MIFWIIYVVGLVISFTMTMVFLRVKYFKEIPTILLTICFLAIFIPYLNVIEAGIQIIYFAAFGLYGMLEDYRERLEGKYNTRNRDYEDQYNDLVKALVAAKLIKSSWDVGDFILGAKTVGKLNSGE